MAEVPHAVLQVTIAGRASQQFGANTHPAVDGPVIDGRQSPVIEFRSSHLSFGYTKDVTGRKDREIYRFAE